MKKIATVAATSLFGLCFACGDGGSSSHMDVRVDTPEPVANAIDFVLPEAEIPVAGDKMFCYYPDFARFTSATGGAEMGIRSLEAMQGLFGHHVVALMTEDTKPVGTLEDCSNEADMERFSLLMVPGVDLPDGYAVKIPEGIQVVLQFHYVNTTTKPLLVRDVARIQMLEDKDVQTWSTPFTTSGFGFRLPPQQPVMTQFDCVVEEDVELLFIGGHMHEEGTRFELLMGPDEDDLTSMLLTDPWRSEFRDAPPVNLFLRNPKQIPAGTLVRTRCDFFNRRRDEIGFPEEMCSSFGYIAGIDRQFDCRVDVSE